MTDKEIELKAMRGAANSYKMHYETCAKEHVSDINVGKILQSPQQPNTNFEMIKKKMAVVTLPGLVKYLMHNMHCEKCPGQKYCNDMACDEAILKWLTSEVENDG